MASLIFLRKFLGLWVYEEAWTVKHERVAKPFSRCGIGNAPVGIEDDVLFEWSEDLYSDSSNDECDSILEVIILLSIHEDFTFKSEQNIPVPNLT